MNPIEHIAFTLAHTWWIFLTAAGIFVAANLPVDRRDPVADAADAAERIRQGVRP